MINYTYTLNNNHLSMENNREIMEELGLEEKEVDIYLASIRLGTAPSSSIANITYLPKSTVRYTLESLVKKQLMNKIQKGNTTLFTPEHPAKLKNLLILEKNKLETKEYKLDKIMNSLVGIYNPHTKIPKVNFYEGLEGIEKVLEDSLSATETIDSFADADSIGNYIPKINKRYSEKRKKLNIKKRAIISDSHFSKDYIKENYSNLDTTLNQFKFLDPKKYDLHISFMLYDGKITYITMEEENYIGVIIENKQIYDFHKNLFKLIWDTI